MITFDNLTLKALINEETEFITGARINKIQQPTRREFILNFRNAGQNRLFYININPTFYHVCFMSKENYDKRVIEIPKKPPMFCMLLRKYLENSKIAKVNLPDNERILEFYIETYNELGEKIYLCLAIELMGKHSNVILYNYDTNMIIGCAHNVGAEKSREREIYGGLPYVYPPKHDNSLKNWTCLMKYLKVDTSINDMVDNYYAEHIAQDKFKTLKTHYKSLLSQRLKKVNKSLKQMEYKLNSDSDYDKYRLWGDLLMANLYALKDYSQSVEVYDYENDKQIVLNLDETKTIKDNAGRFYKLYNKAKTAGTKLVELIGSSKAEKDYLEQVLYSVETAESLDDLNEISQEISILQGNSNSGNSQTQKRTEKLQPEIKTINLEDGSRIFIGKNNKQNDYIISKLASDEDWWFHVHNCAGSHVLLKTKNLTDNLIFECAKLAKKYSSGTNSSKIGVIYTKRKYLRKPPGANLGYVTYRNEKEIIID